MPFMWGVVLRLLLLHCHLLALRQFVGHSMQSDSGVVPVMEVDAIIDSKALREQLNSHAPHCPRAAPFTGIVSCTYHQWLNPFSKRRRYCQISVSGRRMQSFLQFRLGSHNLPVVAGPFCGIARADRVCTHCDGIAVADELHMVHEIQCPVFQPLTKLGNAMLLYLHETPTR